MSITPTPSQHIEKFEIESFHQYAATFSRSHCDTMSEKCITALENNNHATGVKLSVSANLDSQENFEVALLWSKVFSKASYQEIVTVNDEAAEVIAIYLISRLTEFDVVREAKFGGGFDFWLSYKDGHEKFDELQFTHGRLEVSALDKESPSNTVKNRVKGKKKQIDIEAYNHLPAFVCISEFRSPKTTLERVV